MLSGLTDRSGLNNAVKWQLDAKSTIRYDRRVSL